VISLLPERPELLDASPNDAPALPIPVSEWKLDSDATDTGPDHNDGTLVGGSFVNDPTRGGVLSCDGVTAAVRIANRTGPSFTYAAWVWSNTPSTRGNSALDGDAILWSNVSTAANDFTLAVVNDHLAYVNYNEPATGTAAITDGIWHHVAVSRQDGGRVALYVDGRVDGDGNSGAGDVAANPYVFFCGVDSSGGHYFKGAMDDVRQYDRVLAPSEVEAIVAATR
jgi:hypothetical protein